MEFKSLIDTRRSHAPDIILLLTLFVIAFFGVSMVFSASAIKASIIYGDSLFFFKRQVIWVFISFGIIFLLQNFDYRKYMSLTKFFLLFSFAALVALYIPGIGHSAKGSVRWFNLGFFSVQPSEFVKIASIIYLAKVFSAKHEEKTFLKMTVPLAVVGIIFLLVLLQPDFGTAVTLLFVSVAVLFVSGFSSLYLILLALVSVPAFYLIIYQVNYRWMRIIAFLNPWENRYGIGYHITQSFIAFKKGGFFGEGLGLGTQKIGKLPEPHTDFIFAVIGEEAGILGALIIISLFVLFFWRGMKIAFEAVDDFGRVLAIALTLSVTIQAFLNMSVVTGLIPTTGIPLPFISYGGSSMISNMIAAGILLNISKYRETVNETFKSNDKEVWHE